MTGMGLPPYILTYDDSVVRIPSALVAYRVVHHRELAACQD